ncbi:MAG: hypothetical protein ABI811_21140 [Acidobacteriota bacterium]
MRRFLLAFVLLAPGLPAADPVAAMARAKLNLIKEGKAASGSVFVFTPAEVNAWVREELAEEQSGIRETKITFGDGTLAFEALVDLRKLADKKSEMNVLMAKLLEGERPVKMALRPESSAGRLTLHMTSVEISGVPLSGVVLDLLAGFVIRHLYDDAKINEPFDMDHNIDHATLEPAALRVYIKK